ncbi:hypothetical protein KSS87_006720 [Heliosperma pusillum]|nr:hypothetical protein KSS87_006720 [Heliosperma pusillum]
MPQNSILAVSFPFLSLFPPSLSFNHSSSPFIFPSLILPLPIHQLIHLPYFIFTNPSINSSSLFYLHLIRTCDSFEPIIPLLNTLLLVFLSINQDGVMTDAASICLYVNSVNYGDGRGFYKDPL